MTHDEEAINCIVTTLRTLETDEAPDAEDQASAILEALAAEGLYVVRR